MTKWLGLASVLIAAGGAASAADRPVVVELYTSEGCSSCPPADRLLAELASQRSDVLALDLHVTYWNNLGWHDPFSLRSATDRQDRYARLFGTGEVYTPEMVVDGRASLVGSDREAAERAIADAAASGSSVPMRVSVQPSGVTVEVGAGTGEAELVVVGYDGQHETRVGAGENNGRTLREVDVVRSMQASGAWHGRAMTVRFAAPAGEHVAILLQAADGRILGAARPHA